jgi:RNA polymerase sigma-70 factor, ECF subfamily
MALDHDTLVRLLIAEHDKLVAYTWQLVRDDHLVEEVLQEMALVAVQKTEQIVDAAHFLAWSRITCRQVAMSLIRKRGRRPVMLSNAVLDLLEGHWQQRDGLSSVDLLAALRKCVARLGPRARRIVEMRYVEGLRSGEIAKQLGVKAPTMYVTLMRIHRALSDCMKQEEGQDHV